MPGVRKPKRHLRRQTVARGGEGKGRDQRCGRRAAMTDQRHTARLVLKGHIIDSMILPQVMDLVMDQGGNFTIEE
ncbi:MAG TPA: hypothetical protein VNY77_01025, partial [Candidatus Angelobacter sp.]|nr:hypothetical protein [Candidatus Angelobacter sp.]